MWFRLWQTAIQVENWDDKLSDSFQDRAERVIAAKPSQQVGSWWLVVAIRSFAPKRRTGPFRSVYRAL